MHYLFILIPIFILMSALLLWGIFTKWDFIEKLTIPSLGNRICSHIFKRTYLNNKKVRSRLSKRGQLHRTSSWYPSTWKNSKDYISYWKSNNVQKTYQNYIKKNINTKFKTPHPIIHFRCSDVPFNKHPDYRLPKKQVLTLINKILKKKGYKKAIFLSCTDHIKSKCAEKACEKYADYYISLLDIDIEKQCNSQEKDFSLMYNSPFVISLVNSSFSMMAKLHDLDNYKTIYTVNKKINDEIPWAITGSDTISHRDIKDYCNTGEVIGKGIEHYKKKIIGTSFEDIPKDLKKKMNTYLDGLLSTIHTKGEYLSLNGRLAPKNIKTEHLKVAIGSKKHINALIELYYLLSLFHKFALSKKLLYSITAGNLLSYYSGGDILLWDDDIDVHVNTPSFKIMTDLWDNSGKSYKIWDKNWTYKKIIMGSKNIILLRLRNDNFFKIKLNTSIANNSKDIGGLDIFLHWTPRTVPINVKNIVFNTKDENETKYPIINYGPVETRVLRKELAILLLDTMYSKKWPIKKHPSLF